MEKLAMEVAIENVDKVLKAAKAVKIVRTDITTGTSWFEGKERLVKILSTKKGVTLEVNQILSPELITKLEEGKGILEHISLARAKAKHLGTMKYLYKTMDAMEVTEIVTNALANLRIAQAATKEAK